MSAQNFNPVDNVDVDSMDVGGLDMDDSKSVMFKFVCHGQEYEVSREWALKLSQLFKTIDDDPDTDIDGFVLDIPAEIYDPMHVQTIVEYINHCHKHGEEPPMTITGKVSKETGKPFVEFVSEQSANRMNGIDTESFVEDFDIFLDEEIVKAKEEAMDKNIEYVPTPKPMDDPLCPMRKTIGDSVKFYQKYLDAYKTFDERKPHLANLLQFIPYFNMDSFQERTGIAVACVFLGRRVNEIKVETIKRDRAAVIRMAEKAAAKKAAAEKAAAEKTVGY